MIKQDLLRYWPREEDVAACVKTDAEAAHNAVKHARASRMIIGLRSANGEIFLSVHDNGGGFSRELEAAQGMGLQIMRHRAEAIGASLSIQSSPSDGTRVACSIPLSSGNPAPRIAI